MKGNFMSTIVNKPNALVSREYTPCKTGEKEKICLNCPYPNCKTPLTCKRYKEELKKLEVGNERKPAKSKTQVQRKD